MNTMRSTVNRDNYIGKIMKWTSLFILLTLSVLAINSFHQQQLKKLLVSSQLLEQKSILVYQMHNEMLLMSQTQLMILHASNQDEVRQSLWRLSEQVSDYLLHYHQLEAIADNTDFETLTKFRTGFEQWHSFNKDLLGYANIVSDTNFINTLNMVDLAFSQFESNSDEAALLIAQLKQNFDNKEESSN